MDKTQSFFSAEACIDICRFLDIVLKLVKPRKEPKEPHSGTINA